MMGMGIGERVGACDGGGVVRGVRVPEVQAREVGNRLCMAGK